MNFDSLKKEIIEIAEISAKVPESFREKCFEVLLTHLLQAETKTSKEKNPPDLAAPAPAAREVIPPAHTLTLPAALKAFMRRNSVSQEEIEAVVMVGDGELHFIKQPKHQNVSKGQNEWALLLALKNGIVNGSLAVDAEAVRSMVQEQGFYDKNNFSKNFKSPKYAGLYKESLEAQGTAVALSSEGEEQLAALLKSL